MKPTPEHVAEMRRLEATGMGIRTIAREMAATGVSRHYIEKTLRPQNYRRKMAREQAMRGSSYKDRTRQMGTRIVVPPHVVEERNRAYEFPQNCLGDPPIGRSALEQRGG